MLIDPAETGFSFAQRRFEDVVHDAALLVAEQRLQRIGRSAEVLVERANDSRNIGARESLAQILYCALIGLFSGEFSHACAEGVISHVQNCKGEVPALLRDARTHFRPADNELHLARDERLIVGRLNAVTVLGSAGFKKGTDGVMRSHLLEAYRCRLYPFAVKLGSVLVLGDIADRLLQPLEKAGFNRLAVISL